MHIGLHTQVLRLRLVGLAPLMRLPRLVVGLRRACLRRLVPLLQLARNRQARRLRLVALALLMRRLRLVVCLRQLMRPRRLVPLRLQ